MQFLVNHRGVTEPAFALPCVFLLLSLSPAFAQQPSGEDYRIRIPKPERRGDVNYGIWLEFRKPALGGYPRITN